MLFCFTWMHYDIINLYYLNFCVQMTILKVLILLRTWPANFYLYISCHYFFCSFNFLIIVVFLFLFLNMSGPKS
jgi:hypothetical protein